MQQAVLGKMWLEIPIGELEVISDCERKIRQSDQSAISYCLEPPPRILSQKEKLSRQLLQEKPGDGVPGWRE